jgi:dihydroorotate dehydrogenase
MIPIGIAAGMIKSTSEFNRYPGLETQVQHVTFGSFTNGPWVGNKEPTFWYDDETGNSINAVGLTNNGLEWFLTENLPGLVRVFGATKGTCKLRVSLAPRETGDLERMSSHLNTSPWCGVIDEVEINAACPNHRGEAGLHAVLAYDPVAVEILLAETIGLTLPKALKIAPETPKETLEEIVKLCAQYHIQTIVSGNTKRGSSVIRGAQRLSVDQGGRAGNCLLVPGLRQVEALLRLCAKQHVTAGVRIIGCGGVMNASAAHRYADAGADAVQVGTLFYQFGQRGIGDLLVAAYT